MSKENNLIKDFDGWNEYLKELENKLSPILDKKTGKYLFKEGEIWYGSIGVNLGTEICGKNADYERPALVIRKSKRHFVCLPLTSQIPSNPEFYENISYSFTNKKNGKIINVSSFVILTNPISLDVLRLSRKIRRVRDSELIKIRLRLTNYLSGKNP